MSSSRSCAFAGLVLSLAGCAAPAASLSSASPPPPASHLVAASSSRSVWVGGASPSAATPALPPKARRHAVWVSTSACAFPLSAEEAGSEKVPSFDPKRCVAIVERVLVDGEDTDDRVQKVEQLTIEDVAVKLEGLLRRESADDGE